VQPYTSSQLPISQRTFIDAQYSFGEHCTSMATHALVRTLVLVVIFGCAWLLVRFARRRDS